MRLRGCFTPAVVLLAVVLQAGAADKPPTLDADPNLVAWWRLDETAGTIAADSSRHKRDGTLTGDFSFDKSAVAGKAARALQFPGESSRVEIEGYKGVAGVRPRTVAAWIKKIGRAHV